MRELMTRSEDIVLDDTNCFRWLRDRYRNVSHENGYIAELVYLDVPLQDVQARIVHNSMTTSRCSIESDVFGGTCEDLKLRTLMKPQRSCAIMKMSHDGSNRNLVPHDPITVVLSDVGHC